LRRAIFGAERRDRTEAAINHRQLRLGIVGAVVLVLGLVVTGVIYVLPLGQAAYTADLTEARSVRTGDEVRIAGIAVGKVTGLELRPGRVRMSFTVRGDIFVGDQSTLDIRMLTVVGGHYAALVSAGSAPLGSKPIPADRVRLPYSLMRTMQDAAKPVAEVDGTTLRENLAALQTALDRSPDALREAGRAVQSMVTILDRQNSDVSRGLAVTDEFLTAINANKSLIGTFVRQIGLIEVQTLDKKADLIESLRVSAELLSRIAAVEPTWREALQPIFHQLTLAGPAMRELLSRTDQALATLRDLQTELLGAISPQDGVNLDQSAISLAAPTVCIPVPGRKC
jgi:phospholipid/cholesterol/gamma-HCH transport system substrate-binding protein